jgi:hypothetical protein
MKGRYILRAGEKGSQVRFYEVRKKARGNERDGRFRKQDISRVLEDLPKNTKAVASETTMKMLKTPPGFGVSKLDHIVYPEGEFPIQKACKQRGMDYLYVTPYETRKTAIKKEVVEKYYKAVNDSANAKKPDPALGKKTDEAVREHFKAFVMVTNLALALKEYESEAKGPVKIAVIASPASVQRIRKLLKHKSLEELGKKLHEATNDRVGGYTWNGLVIQKPDKTHFDDELMKLERECFGIGRRTAK